MLSLSLAFVLLCSAFSFAVASPEHSFDWKFPDSFTSDELSECANMSIYTTTSNSSYTGTPPFYFTAYEMDGISTMQVLTPDEQGTLHWKVDHKVGSKLALSILDSEGQSGGMANTFYHVTSSSGDSCLPASDSSNGLPHITANVTSPNSINTCDPWGLTITGGTAPYNVTLVALNEPTQVNMTLGAQDDVLTFINRAPPDVTLIALVLDANGNFGTGTLSVQTRGSNDTSCTGLVTRSHNSAEVARMDGASAAAARAAHARTVATALSVTFILLFLFALAGYIFLRRRRRQQLGLAHASDSEKSTDNDRWYRTVVVPAILPRSSADREREQTVLVHSPQATAGSPGGASVITGPLDLPSRRPSAADTLASSVAMPPPGLSGAHNRAPSAQTTIVVQAPTPARDRKRLTASRSMNGLPSAPRPATRLPARSSSALAGPAAGAQRGSQDSTAPLVRRPLGSVEEVFQHEDAEDAAARSELPPPYRSR